MSNNLIDLFIVIVQIKSEKDEKSLDGLRPRFGFIAIKVIEELGLNTRTKINKYVDQVNLNFLQYQDKVRKTAIDSISNLDLYIDDITRSIEELKESAISNGKDPSKCNELSKDISSNSCKLKLDQRFNEDVIFLSEKLDNFVNNQELAKDDVDRLVMESKKCTLDFIRLRYFKKLQEVNRSTDTSYNDIKRELNKSTTGILSQTSRIIEECKRDNNLKFDEISECYLSL